MSRRRDQLDSRVWLLWAVAAGLPALLGRNPFVLFAVLLACLGVRGAVVPEHAATASWGWIIRLAALFAFIGAVFNLLTVHIGDQQIAALPGSIPIIGGSLTWNALVYGLLSGLAILVLVIIGVTLAACLDHAELLRMLPGRLTTVAVAGSVALAFLPQTVTAFHEIREAQAARGYRLRGARGLVPLIVPLLTGGLERALTLAEALESRGFGASAVDFDDRLGRSARDPSPGLTDESRLKPTDSHPPIRGFDIAAPVPCHSEPRRAKNPRAERVSVTSVGQEHGPASPGDSSTSLGMTGNMAENAQPKVLASSTVGFSRLPSVSPGLESRAAGAANRAGQTSSAHWRSIATVLSLTALTAGSYLLAVGNARIGLAALGLGIIAFVMAGWEPRQQRFRRTRYRQATWSWRDTVVAAAAVVTLAAEIIVLKRHPVAFQYQPYPGFTAPPINLGLLVALSLLLAPALVTPAPTSPDVTAEDGWQ